jgi:hypothetical protein
MSIAAIAGVIALLVATESFWAHQSDSKPVSADGSAIKGDAQPMEESQLPENPKERATRLAKNLRYNAHEADLTKRSDESFIEQVWPRSLPVIPAKESALVLVGTVVKMQPYLSGDRSRIYTELTIQSEEVVASDVRLSTTKVPVIDRIGGVLKTQSGQVVRDGIIIDGLGRTRVGGRYVLFAKRIHHGKDLTLIRGYELREGQVFKLTEDGNPGDVLVSSIPGDANIPSEEKAFIQALRSAAQGKRVHQVSYAYDAPK